jgi:amidase
VARQIATGEVSSSEYVASIIADLEERDEHYRVVVTDLFERATEQARRSDIELAANGPLGPLHGVPFGVKDLFDIAGVATGAGSTIAAQNIADTTAGSVARLERAGAIPVAKLAMTEFAGTAHHDALPTPVNPYHSDHSPGGSSSGSAVAVAAGLIPFALGSDTVASIRLPAAWNGCVGFKPTYGRVNRHGVFPLAATFDHPGALTRTVEDAIVVTAAMAGRDENDPTTRYDDLLDPGSVSLTGLRVGYDAEFVEQRSIANVGTPALGAIDVAAQAGAHIADITVPLRNEAVDHYHSLLCAEIAHAHRATYPQRRDEYTPSFARLLHEAGQITTSQVVAASEFRIGYDRAIEQMFANVDIIVTPVAPFNAPPITPGADASFDRNIVALLQFTWLWNLCGAPAVAIPWGLDAGGLPNSIQVIAAPGRDDVALAAAAALQIHAPRTPLPAMTA